MTCWTAMVHRTPVSFHISNDYNKHPMMPRLCRQPPNGSGWRYNSSTARSGEGICTDMRAVRKDYFLDHDHSAYVDQWDWERVITAEERNLALLEGSRWRHLESTGGAERFAARNVPSVAGPRYPNLPEKLTSFMPKNSRHVS